MIILTVMLFNRKQLNQFKTTRRARDLKRSLGCLIGRWRSKEREREREAEKLKVEDIKGKEIRREE